MMDHDVYLKDIIHESHTNEKVCDWDYMKVDGFDVRIYYKQQDIIGTGFDFYAVKYIGCISNEATKLDEWNENYCYVDCMFRGIACFNGIRHLYYGDEKTDNYGYHYYANLTMISYSLIYLKDLERRYCREYKEYKLK
jgi:hypothetical protein